MSDAKHGLRTLVFTLMSVFVMPYLVSGASAPAFAEEMTPSARSVSPTPSVSLAPLSPAFIEYILNSQSDD